ncbi:MAG: hypothetical protein ACFE8Z_11045, partial [Candidatus Hermodarchaeota archaeon]
VSAIFAGNLYRAIHNLAADYFGLFALPTVAIYSIVILLKKDYDNLYALIGIILVYIGGVSFSGIFFGSAQVAISQLTYYMIPTYLSIQGFGFLRYSRKSAEVQATARHQLEE